MIITVDDMGVAEAARVISDMAVVARDSAERGELPSDIYTGTLEVIAAVAAAISRCG